MSLDAWYHRTIEYLLGRKHSYFMGLPALLRKQRPTPDGNAMLADLARFCRATTDCFGATDRDTYILIGRRQVWLRITQHLNLSPDELYRLYASHRPPKEDEQ